ncbi:MAG: 50S ribosomal protein L25 [Candidatus Pacebacteria bacterium]|nr:50S ribosomal protein L25 [Candidatus Paceibacterota bacterium]
MKISYKTREGNKSSDGSVLGVVYGPGVENIKLEVDLKDFVRVYDEAGENSLISLEASDDSKKFLVLIQDIQKDPISGEVIHIDFYQPKLDSKVDVSIPLEFIGLAPAIKELGGTLVKNFLEIEVKALPQKLPKSIEVDLGKLVTFDDVIVIGDLKIPDEVEVFKELDEIIALVTPIETEEETTKPIEEDVEAVTKVEKKEKEKVEDETK